MQKRRHLSGFTLLEIMLVIVLLSMTAVMVVPTFPKPSNDAAKLEAERFYQLIQLWNEQSLLKSAVMGVIVERNRYFLMELAGNNWKEVNRTKRISTSITMPEEIELEINIEGLNDEDQLFSRESLFDDTMFADVEEKPPEPPQLVLMGNGEIFPFALTFSADNKPLWEVTGTDVGEFKLASLNEDRE